MGRLVVALGALLMVSSGCVGSGEEGNWIEPSTSATLDSADAQIANETVAPIAEFLETQACWADMGVVFVPWAEAQSKLPKGFRPSTLDPNLKERAAMVGILHLWCQQGKNATLSFGSQEYLWHWLVVEAPPEFDAEGLTNRLFPLHVSVDSEQTMNVLAALGQPSSLGRFTNATHGPTPT